MIADFLLELRCEEIPARMQDKARADLARLVGEELAKAGLAADAVETYATPRRLALIARNLPLATEAVSEEQKGPRTSAPPQALEGFLRKTGLTADLLEDRDGIWFAVIERPGRATADVLAEAIPAIIRAFPWPKSMRWGDASASTESLRWVRPLQGIVALLGNDVVPCTVDGVASGSTTMGHRFHHSGPVTIGNAADYAMKLRAAHVIVNQEERRAIIRDRAGQAAAAAGLALVADEGLVNENRGLTEWPVPLLGRFDPAFLAVPPEVIQLTARVNQKYFVCEDAAGQLANAFVCTANIEASDGGTAIIAGNEKVLAARLSDAKFFWEQDLKVPLEEQAAKLAQITFHEKLGTVADKVERVAKLAEWLASEGVVPDCDPALARRAAELCKADLVTGMVGEFPELQGVMGGYYARAQGETDAVADAIRDHYKPIGQGDDVPTAPVTVALSLADKLDTAIAMFAVDELPTGSKDPFALRRAFLGVSSIIHENELRLSLLRVIDLVLDALFDRFTVATSPYQVPEKWVHFASGMTFGELDRSLDIYFSEMPIDIDEFELPCSDQEALGRSEYFLLSFDETTQRVQQFFADRLKVQQRDAGVRHDLIDAVFALGGEDDLVRLLARVKALQAFMGTADGTNLLAAYKRAANLLKQADSADPSDPRHAEPGSASMTGPSTLKQVQGDERLTVQDQALLAALDAAEPTARAAVEAEDFTAAMAALASLRAPIDAFFDGVMVNDPDPDVRAMRLALLARFRDAVHQVADFSKIEG